MSDLNFIHDKLTEAETVLAARKRQRSQLDNEIETIEAVIRVYGDFVYHNRDRREASSSSDNPVLSQRHRFGSKRIRITNAIKQMLVERGTMHRNEIADNLKVLGLLAKPEGILNTTSNYLSGMKSRGELESDNTRELREAGNQIADEDLAHVWPLHHTRIIPNGTGFLNWPQPGPAMVSA
jgi:hypothetical protein